jgi:hypothetical protein
MIPFPTWSYRPPFLSDGMSIHVALASNDLALPFVFRSPGGLPPSKWTDGRACNLQKGAGLAWIRAVEVALPVGADGAVPTEHRRRDRSAQASIPTSSALRSTRP